MTIGVALNICGASSQIYFLRHLYLEQSAIGDALEWRNLQSIGAWLVASLIVRDVNEGRFKFNSRSLTDVFGIRYQRKGALLKAVVVEEVLRDLSRETREACRPVTLRGTRCTGVVALILRDHVVEDPIDDEVLVVVSETRELEG